MGCGGWGGVDRVCTVIFGTSPTTVLTLCCVVVGSVTKVWAKRNLDAKAFCQSKFGIQKMFCVKTTLGPKKLCNQRYFGLKNILTLFLHLLFALQTPSLFPANILQTHSRHPPDTLKTTSRCAQDALQTPSSHPLYPIKTPSRRPRDTL